MKANEKVSSILISCSICALVLIFVFCAGYYVSFRNDRNKAADADYARAIKDLLSTLVNAQGRITEGLGELQSELDGITVKLGELEQRNRELTKQVGAIQGGIGEAITATNGIAERIRAIIGSTTDFSDGIERIESIIGEFGSLIDEFGAGIQ